MIDKLTIVTLSDKICVRVNPEQIPLIVDSIGTTQVAKFQGYYHPSSHYINMKYVIEIIQDPEVK